MPSLTTIVSPNGLGHLRRTMLLAEHLRRLRSDVVHTVLCEQWQIDRLQVGDAPQTHFVTGLMAPGVTWERDPRAYGDGRLTAWELRVGALAAVHEADVVVSDNLAGILRIRDDAILAGSFLWSDVLGDAYREDAEVMAFVQHERELLARHRPRMICVADGATPGVRERANAIAVGWMCPWLCEADNDAERSGRVALLGGATGAVDHLLDEVGHRLREQGLADAAGPTSGFGFGAQAYASRSVIVCRPGMGTVSDCLGAGVPLVLVYEAGNSEMTHMANRLAALGVGIDCGSTPTVSAVVDAVCTALAPQTQARMRQRIAELDRQGYEEAATWLAQQLPGGEKHD